jgi:cyclin H
MMATEDDRYRTSTQYRLWSYTPAALRSLRTTTNANAATQVREAVRRAREAHALSSNDNSEGENSRSASAALPEGEVDCLTVDEELKLLDFYCRQTLQLGDHLDVPLDVKVCAILSIPSICLYLGPRVLYRISANFFTIRQLQSNISAASTHPTA